MANITNEQKEEILDIVKQYGRNPGHLMDIIHAIQDRNHYISQDVIDFVAEELGVHRVAVDDMVSFYSFLYRQPGGVAFIYLSYCPGHDQTATEQVAEAFKKYLDVDFGETTSDSLITLEKTGCIGMCDQRPAALLGNLILTRITPEDVPAIVEAIRSGQHKTPVNPVTPPNLTEITGTSSTFFPNASVQSIIRQSGECVFSPFEPGNALRTAINLGPENIIKQIGVAGLRGRGGAGFPTSMKWDFCRQSPGTAHYIICNADEGEPGTFKDRAILTEVSDLMFEGMTIGGYALDAKEGYLYLRGEYRYLLPHLELVLARRRKMGLLGKNICGKAGFHFDIRIRLGAGAYICGEESALIESLEGKRGAPRDRPPYPVHKGYRNLPTAVNNVETLACVARIFEKGATWFAGIGSRDSKGNKVFSVSGDCHYPGIYELPFGLTINELLDKVGAIDTQAIQLGGASGICLGPKDYGRRIAYEDVATNGSVIIIGQNQDLLDVVASFAGFFKHESCGWCVPCRVGTTMLVKKIQKFKAGRATEEDLMQLKRWCNLLRTMSRCGLGMAAPNPILSTLRNFPDLYENKLASPESFPGFNLEEALKESYEITGRKTSLDTAKE